jgi:hypothetical protein
MFDLVAVHFPHSYQVHCFRNSCVHGHLWSQMDLFPLLLQATIVLEGR